MTDQEYEKPGELSILNVGTGDTKLSFDSDNPEEVLRASRVVQDMLRRGYAILVEVGKDDKGPLYRRALEFDEKTNEYIIAGAPEIPTEDTQPASEPTPKPRRKTSAGRGRAKPERVAAGKAKAVAVPRTAGG